MRSLAQRLRNKFSVAVAEVDHLDAWQIATFGVTCVANSRAHCEKVLDEVLRYVRESRLDAELIAEEIEIFALFD